MSTYIIVKQGVYQQGVYGCCDNVEDAIALAKALANDEADDYHTFDVHLLDAAGESEATDYSYRKADADDTSWEEDDERAADADGQPTEQEEWFSFDPEC